MDYPALMDPRTMGILSAAFAGLNASGPSRMPVSLGQVIGQAGQAGLGTFQQAQEAQRKYEQTQALVNLEKQRADLTAAQIDMARRKQQGLDDLYNQFGGGPAATVGGQGVGIPGPAGAAPAAPGSPRPMLPPHLVDAVRADLRLNDGKGVAGILAKGGIVEIPGVGAVQYTPNGYVQLPGLADAMKAWKLAGTEVENDNTLVDVPLPNGQTQRMTKTAALQMARGSAPGAGPSAAPAGGVEFNVEGMRGTAPDEASALAIGRKLQGFSPTPQPTPQAPQMPGFATGKPTQQVINEEGQKTAVTETAKNDANTVSTYRQKLPSMASAMVSINQLEQLNADNKTYASAGAEFKKDLGRIAQAFGIKVNEKETANTELYIARLGELLKERLASKDYGSGTGVSNLDLATAGVPLPEVAKTQEGRQKIIEAIKKDMMRSYNDMRGAVDYFETNNRLSGFRFPSEAIMAAQPAPIPKTPAPGRPANTQSFDALPPASQHKGVTLRDKTTGKVVKSDGMSWKEQ